MSEFVYRNEVMDKSDKADLLMLREMDARFLGLIHFISHYKNQPSVLETIKKLVELERKGAFSYQEELFEPIQKRYDKLKKAIRKLLNNHGGTEETEATLWLSVAHELTVEECEAIDERLYIPPRREEPKITIGYG